MILPYYLGCPSWSENAWRGSLYPADAQSSQLLGLYTQMFNAVEGNTTFYARPSAETVQRWADVMPAHFRFTAKFNRDISHADDLRERLSAAEEFLQLLAPLGERVAPLWLQLPRQFGPARLAELAAFIAEVQRPLAVEVRHPAFFAGEEDERQLNRLLLDSGVERICLDSRPLFSCISQDPAVLNAQSKKPRVKVRPSAFTQFPQVRFIGRPEPAENEAYMTQWLGKVAGWIEEGRTPYVFLHTPDNVLAAQLARRFHERLMELLPGLVALPELPKVEPVPQMSLL